MVVRPVLAKINSRSLITKQAEADAQPVTANRGEIGRGVGPMRACQGSDQAGRDEEAARETRYTLKRAGRDWALHARAGFFSVSWWDTPIAQRRFLAVLIVRMDGPIDLLVRHFLFELRQRERPHRDHGLHQHNAQRSGLMVYYERISLVVGRASMVRADPDMSSGAHALVCA